jgi:hypothetical protein
LPQGKRYQMSLTLGEELPVRVSSFESCAFGWCDEGPPVGYLP